MHTMKPLRLLGAATLVSVSAFAASAQTTAPAPSAPPAEKPPMNRPAPDATPPSSMPPASQTTPKPSATNEAHPMVGKTALSSDGNKIGDIRAVKTGVDGKVTAIQLKVGGFLGFGGKIVEVADGKFTQKGDTIQLGYTSDEMSNLPEVKDAG